LTSYLLDTNVISVLLRQPRGKIKERIEDVGEDTVWTSIVVASELRFGARKKGSHKLTARVDAFLASIRVAPLDHPVDDHYAALRHFLEDTGQLIGPNDMLIAAHALAEDAHLVTDNVGEFERLPDLKVTRWSNA